jgi:hypothetical protein
MGASKRGQFDMQAMERSDSGRLKKLTIGVAPWYVG